MDFAKLMDRFGRMWQNFKQQSNQPTTSTSDGNVVDRDREKPKIPIGSITNIEPHINPRIVSQNSLPPYPTQPPPPPPLSSSTNPSNPQHGFPPSPLTMPVTPSCVPSSSSQHSHHILQHSFSAAQTPESPSLSGFRRQLSLNMFNRANKQSGSGTSGLHLDLNRRPNNNNSHGSISGVPNCLSNELIDTHSLSPRPRPKNLGLSNSHDNITKNAMYGNDRSNNHGGGNGLPFHISSGANTCSSASSRHRKNFGLNFGASSSPSGNGPGSNNRSQPQFYQFPTPPSARLKDEFAKNNRTIKINGKKYENINEKDFKKISELGHGSFGQVEKMLHKPSGIELAVKKMRRSGNQDENKHIINDLELLRKCVDFANIVQCYGYYIMETEVWIFMELMTTCFDRLLKRLREPIPEDIIGKIAVATVKTLDYLKVNHDVIHRDIKPSNILINRQGVIKLCDFGISGRLIDSKAHSRSVGCAAYMAPERIQPPDSSGTYDIRSDVWSLGITLVEIATGQFPYQNWNSDFELLSKVIQDDPPLLPTSGGFTPNFCSFIKACLTKNYAERPKYKDLMEHPFYRHYDSTVVNVADWFKHAYIDIVDTSSMSSTSSLASMKNP
ncbi:Dual specificity mitogen-activated protein kinase kinase 7 [Blomia tropicalis]|nr:Dual specificity mitogen-activated protein kinase kinase 7 [Blomia tropicalis]